MARVPASLHLLYCFTLYRYSNYQPNGNYDFDVIRNSQQHLYWSSFAVYSNDDLHLFCSASHIQAFKLCSRIRMLALGAITQFQFECATSIRIRVIVVCATLTSTSPYVIVVVSVNGGCITAHATLMTLMSPRANESHATAESLL